MKKNKKVRNKIDRILEVPDEVVLDVPKITILKFEQMIIENYKGILEYQDFFVRLKTNIGIINVNGFNLSLEEMTSDDIRINGKIESIDYESIEDYGEE